MFRLESPAFAEKGDIPRKYTSDGANVSPPLHWADAPAETRSFALLIEDPDAPDPSAPTRTWVHWIVYNLPASAHDLSEGASSHMGFPGARQGTNDWNLTGYGGPSPPIGRHRYQHKLFALDTAL